MGEPVVVVIEPASVCNLRCEICETGSGVLGRKAEFMTYDNFKIIMDKIYYHTNTLMFYFMGESFLNKSAYDMIAYAKTKGIPFVTACTNGDAVDPQKLIDSGIDEIQFQIAGTTQQAHQTYRAGSNVEKVLSKLKETVEIRNRANAKTKIRCGFIVMKHNEHQIDEFKTLMQSIKVDGVDIVAPCFRTIEQAQRMLPISKEYWLYDSEALKQGILKPKTIPHNECAWLYYSITTQVNGDVVPCCRDATGKEIMGNLLQNDLKEIWNGPAYLNFRERVFHNQRSVGLCKLCSAFGVPVLK
ncbi:MAG: SPASM domain-containing protein [Candidatus Pacebacteria bacterium]|nr:SPASM domain-containing protein [Candidatus Paceibacterota bacterium]